MNRRVAFGLSKTSALSSPLHRSSASQRSQLLNIEDARLLERFSGEVFASALSCAAIMSCFNMIQFDREILIPRDLRTYLPLNPLSFSAVLSSDIADLLQHETRAALSGYQYYLEAGKRLLSGYLDPGRVEIPIDFDVLKAMQTPFTTASMFSMLTLKDLARLHSDLGADRWSEDLRTLAGDLDAATRGDSPYFQNRKFDVPGAADQMRGLRIQLNSEATLTYHGMARQVLIRDISQGGLGVEGVTMMQPGTPVRLLLPTGRELIGEICWQEDTRAGISLSERLPLSDPLMCA